VQTRRIKADTQSRKEACHYNLVDSVVALNGALFVNAAILVMAAAVFFKNGKVVTEIQQAHLLLAPLLGTSLASVLFAVALLCSGQSSTLTGTMAGQIVMEGFLNFRMRPWLRRLITRMLAIVPAAIVIYISGEQGTYKLLILSQVVLSMQLPFAVVPLIHFTSDRKRMDVFANKAWVKLLAWLAAAIIVSLNVRLVYTTIASWLEAAGSLRWLVLLLVVPLTGGLALLLVWVSLEPWLPHWIRSLGRKPVAMPESVTVNLPIPAYKSILVPLDHTARDRQALAHGAAMALQHKAKLWLLHVEEDVTSQIYGAMSSTAEVEEGAKYLREISEALRAQSISVETVICHSKDPTEEIVGVARRLAPDLIVMGAHGHKWFKDLVLGNTINSVRHQLEVPILIVRDEK
jgi:manganese transport protein